MKKSNTGKKRGLAGKKRADESVTIGLDLGDRSSRYCILDGEGEVLVERSVATTQKGLDQVFGAMARCRVALEVSTHSPWVSRHLAALGHEVIVANARRVRLISESNRKDDKLDARTLSRLARIDPELLSPIRHRGEQGQGDLMMIRARAALVEMRTALINAARGLAKSFGERLPSCASNQVREELADPLSAPLQGALRPLLDEVGSVTQRIRDYDLRLDEIAKDRYPEVARLKQIQGVGTLIALTFVLALEDPHRFRSSRQAGCYAGLRVRRDEPACCRG